MVCVEGVRALLRAGADAGAEDVDGYTALDIAVAEGRGDDILAALGPFDLDPCACMEPRPWPTAEKHYTRIENGLTRFWHGRVFLNPPYGPPSVVTPWMRRMAAHRQGIALIFARTETALFHKQVFPVASALLFLEGRLFFHRRDGSRAQHNAGAPSVLIAYGPQDARTLKTCGLAGAYMRLQGPD